MSGTLFIRIDPLDRDDYVAREVGHLHDGNVCTIEFETSKPCAELLHKIEDSLCAPWSYGYNDKSTSGKTKVRITFILELLYQSQIINNLEQSFIDMADEEISVYLDDDVCDYTLQRRCDQPVSLGGFLWRFALSSWGTAYYLDPMAEKEALRNISLERSFGPIREKIDIAKIATCLREEVSKIEQQLGEHYFGLNGLQVIRARLKQLGISYDEVTTETERYKLTDPGPIQIISYETKRYQDARKIAKKIFMTNNLSLVDEFLSKATNHVEEVKHALLLSTAFEKTFNDRSRANLYFEKLRTERLLELLEDAMESESENLPTVLLAMASFASWRRDYSVEWSVELLEIIELAVSPVTASLVTANLMHPMDGLELLQKSRFTLPEQWEELYSLAERHFLDWDQCQEVQKSLPELNTWFEKLLFGEINLKRADFRMKSSFMEFSRGIEDNN